MTTLDAGFFRHEFGRLVALLSRRVGLRHLEEVEDAVQQALQVAVERWPREGVPDDRSAWLYRVARNHVLGELRKEARRAALLRAEGRGATGSQIDPPAAFLPGELRDDLLRMLFACCDGELPIEAQLALALRTLCGFDVREIAERLFTSEASVYKRLERARHRLREMDFGPRDLSVEELAARLPTVQSVLYVLFTEGHLSSHAEAAIRCELCDEAIRLSRLLVEHPVGQTPATFALLSLMLLHRARMPARQDPGGALFLLEEQDRSLWDATAIEESLQWLARAAEGEEFSRYHAEAGIAAAHCMAPTFEDTRWDHIVECYDLLERSVPSPFHALSRAVALAQWRGPAEALAELESLRPPPALAGSYLWSAVLADLHRRCGHAERAATHRARALGSAPSSAVRAALERRLGGEISQDPSAAGGHD